MNADLLVDVTRGRALILRRPDVRPILMRRTQRTWFWCEGGSRFHLERGGGLAQPIEKGRKLRLRHRLQRKTKKAASDAKKPVHHEAFISAPRLMSTH